MTRYSWANGTIGTRTPASRPSSAANIPPALTTISASTSPHCVCTPLTRPPATSIPRHPRVREHLHAAGRARHRSARRSAATGRGSRRSAGRRRSARRRSTISGNSSCACSARDQLERKPERLCPGDLAQHLLLALGRAGQADAAALHPAAVERPVERDRVHHHPRQRDARRAAARLARPSETSSRWSARCGRAGSRRARRAAPGGRRSPRRRRRRR